jgi:antitoxin PrlF
MERNLVRSGAVGKDMAKATLTSKGQITIPKEIRDHLGLSAGDRLDFQIADSGAVLVEPETVDMRSLRSLLKPRGRKVSLAEMDRAIRRGASGR